jgi:hypothetical protein
VVYHDEKLFTFGGSISDQFFVKFDVLTVFNLAMKDFERLRTKADQQHGYPEARSCHSLVHRGNEVFILGGRDVEIVSEIRFAK